MESLPHVQAPLIIYDTKKKYIAVPDSLRASQVLVRSQPYPQHRGESIYWFGETFKKSRLAYLRIGQCYTYQLPAYNVHTSKNAFILENHYKDLVL